MEPDLKIIKDGHEELYVSFDQYKKDLKLLGDANKVEILIRALDSLKK